MSEKEGSKNVFAIFTWIYLWCADKENKKSKATKANTIKWVRKDEKASQSEAMLRSGAETVGAGEQLWSQSEELIWESNRQQGIVAGLKTFLTILTQLLLQMVETASFGRRRNLAIYISKPR